MAPIINMFVPGEIQQALETNDVEVKKNFLRDHAKEIYDRLVQLDANSSSDTYAGNNKIDKGDFNWISNNKEDMRVLLKEIGFKGFEDGHAIVDIKRKLSEYIGDKNTIVETTVVETQQVKESTQKHTQVDIQEQKDPLVNMDLVNKASILKKGSKDSFAVAEVQRFLTGYRGSDIEVNGDFNQGTYKAIKSFQTAMRIGVDGDVGPQTKRAMKAHMDYQDNVVAKVEANDPTRVFDQDGENTVSKKEINDSLDTTHKKLHNLNVLITEGTKISEAIESYINGGDRDQFISNKGGVYGWIREAMGANEFDTYLDELDGISNTQKSNINTAVEAVLGNHGTSFGEKGHDSMTGISGQLEKDAMLMIGSLLLSGGSSMALPIGHLTNGFSRKLVDNGVDLKKANNLAAYIEGTAGKEPFNPEQQYVSEHGLDSLASVVQLKHMLREYGISDNEIDAVLSDKISETSTKIRTVIESFLTHIVVRDLDALIKGSFGLLEKAMFLPLGKKLAVPGNPDVTMSDRYFGGDPKYGALLEIIKRFETEIASLKDGGNISEVLKNIDIRMEGASYLLQQQFDDVWMSDGDENATQDLNDKVDYMVALDANSPFFETYPVLAKNPELLRNYSILTKFASVTDILNNFPASEEAAKHLATLTPDSSLEDFKIVLAQPEVGLYLMALTRGVFTEYRRAQLKQETGLKKVELEGVAKHGLPVTRESTGQEVVEQMKTNSVDGKYSVLTTIEETLIDNGITTISSADIAAAIQDNWTVVELTGLNDAISNTGQGDGTSNDRITSFKELMEERGDTFLFQTTLEKKMSYLDKDGNTHDVTHRYTILFRPECKNPIIHRDIIDSNGTVMKPAEIADFNTAVPSLITGTIPLWLNVNTGRGSSSSGSGNSNESGDGFTTTPGDADAVNINNATVTTNTTVSGGASGAAVSGNNALGI